MKRIHALRLMAIILLAAFQIVVLWGCSQNQNWSPAAPSANGTSAAYAKADDDDDDDDDIEFLRVARRDPAENGVSTALIGPAGGVLHHAAHRLEVPAGALNEPLELTFSMPLSDTLTFDMGPHGTQFNSNVRLVFNYGNADLTGVNEALLNVYYYDPNTGVFERIFTTVDTVNKLVIGHTDHFSRYALIGK